MSPQKKAILVGLILGVGVLLALPFRHAHPPDTEEVPNRVARDIWLQKPGWNAEEEKEADLNDGTLSEGNANADLTPGNSLLQEMEDNLEPIVKRPDPFSVQPPQPIRERKFQQPPIQEPKLQEPVVRQKPAPAARQRYSTGNATLGSDLVPLPPDMVVVERPADQYSANNDDIQGSANQDASKVDQRKPVQRPEPRAPKTIRHTVRDGDTLQSLAERYLGDSRRGLEILKANEAKLKNSNALPIDDELIIILK